MLHILGFPPERTDLLDKLTRVITAGDQVVLIDQGVGFTDSGMLRALVERLPENTLIHLVTLSNAGTAQRSPELRVLDFDGFIALTETQYPACSWYP